MINVLILGSKEYPFGTNGGDDPVPSGGMETYVDDLAPELSRLCGLVIVTRRFRGTRRHEKKGNIEIYRVPWLRGRWLRNPSFNKMSFLLSLRLASRADVVYSNGIVSGFAGLVLARMFRKNAVYRPAGTAFLQQRFPLRQALMLAEKAVMLKSDAVVFHSEGEKRNAERALGIKLRNGEVILTGFPVAEFASAGRLSKSGENGSVTITSISRFVPVKDLGGLLRACSLLEEDYELLMVGSGPEEGRLKRLSKELGLSEKAVFTGFRHDVPEILAQTDIFVVSSLSEGLPTSLLEAMAAGKACVVTDIGLPVEHMRTGVVVRPGRPELLAKAISMLARDPPLRKRLGEAARKFVMENCTQRMAAEKHCALFRRLGVG